MYLRPALPVILLLTLAAPRLHAQDLAPPPPTLEAVHPGLSFGPLRQASLVPLPEDLLIRAQDLTITEEQVAAEIAEAGEDLNLRSVLEKNAPYLAERLAVKALLLSEARAWAQARNQPVEWESPASLVETYLRSLVEQVVITSEELKAFYTANRAMFPDTTYEQVAEQLRTYLLSQKEDRFIEAHVNSLSKRVPVEVNAAWFQTHAPTALDTPVDQARRSGKPSLIDFGAGGCLDCDRMTPLLEDLRQFCGERANVLFVSVRDHPLLGARYNVRGIPLQIVFDAQGREVLRHEGFWPREAMITELAKLGVQ